MAALPQIVGAPPTFAEQLGLDPSEAITFTTAARLAPRLAPPTQLSHAIVASLDWDKAGVTKLVDLPLHDINESKQYTHLIDIIHDHSSPIDRDAIVQIAAQGTRTNAMALPPPLCPKTDCVVEYTVDISS